MELIRLIGRWWRSSIRRQLVLGFAFASLALMLGFGYLVLEQQREAQYQFSEERSVSLAHALSTAGISWTLANDLVGLQEVVQGFAKTPDLQRAYFLNPRGEVLASTNPGEVGFFVTDEVSRNMLASTAMDQLMLVSQKNLVVVAHPVMSDGRRLGWVRVEMSRDTVNANLSALTRMWGAFLLFAVIVVSLVALFLAQRLTRGLHHLMQVTVAVEQGSEELRADSRRADEIGALARNMDRMLDTLERQKREIRESEAKYRFMADNVSDVIWIVNVATNRWKYVSPSVEKLLGYTVEEIMQQSLDQTFTPESYRKVRELIAARSNMFLNGGEWNHVFSDELEQRRRDGSTVWTEVTTTHVSRNEMNELVLLGVTRDISERKKAEEQIRNLAFYDPLTQLPNRRLLIDRFGLVISMCKRNNCYAALMFIDLDNFKPLNDEHGHDVGDMLLVEVAHRLTSCVREVDTVSRFGGDEFVVMLTELDADKAISMKQAGVIAEKIRQILGEPYKLSILKEGGLEASTVEHRCTASIGVALFSHQISSQEELLKLADTAMYEAKSSGRNQVHFADV